MMLMRRSEMFLRLMSTFVYNAYPMFILPCLYVSNPLHMCQTGFASSITAVGTINHVR